ncbi:hypothetical protein ACYQOP_13310 [Methylobacterium sp. CM6247]
MRSLPHSECKINCLRLAFLTEADFGMQHFDNGHLPEPEEHFADRFAQDAILCCLVAVEAVGLGLTIFGIVHLSRWLLA